MTRVKFNSTKKDHIYWYKDSDGSKKYAYRYRFYDANDKRRERSKRGFETEAAAVRALTNLKATLLNGGTRVVVNENMTVAQWLDIYYEKRKPKWKVSSVYNYERIIRLYLKPYLGHYRLSKLTKNIYELEFIEKLKDAKSAKSIELYHCFFMGAINAAVEDEIIQQNKLNKAELPKIPKQNMDEVEGNYLTPEELEKLLKCVQKSFNIMRYTLILLLANTGMRRGEACALKWSDIDFEKKCIFIKNTRDYLGQRSAKTDNSVRKVDLNNSIIAQLEKYLVWCKKHKLTLGIIHSSDDHVFISRTCNPISEDVANIVLSEVAELYDLKRITPHGLRHTFTTILIDNNVPVTTVAKLIGDTPQTVMKTYAHSFAKREKVAMNILELVVNLD